MVVGNTQEEIKKATLAIIHPALDADLVGAEAAFDVWHNPAAPTTDDDMGLNEGWRMLGGGGAGGYSLY